MKREVEPASAERVADERRRHSARIITLALAVLAGCGSLFGWLTQIPDPYTVGMAFAAVVSLGAYGLARIGREQAGVTVLLVVTFAVQTLMVAVTGALQTVPYMATVGVLIGAATLRIRGLSMVTAIAVLIVFLQGAIVGFQTQEQVKAFGYIAGAEMLVLVAFVLSYLHIRSNERAFQVAREREQERERIFVENEALAQELEKSRRIEALGRLAGRIAHDFNNLLSVIAGSTELAQAELPEAHPARRELDEVTRTAERAKRLIRQLLSLSRGQIVAPAPLDVAEQLCGMRELLVRLAGPACHVDLRVASVCPRVAIEPTHLEQLLVNFVANSRDALSEGGHIEVRLRPRTVAEGEVWRLPAGEYVELAVADDGPGISEEARLRLFEPFFTTKSNGTGLGLATCHGLATQLGGTVVAATKAGDGTTMRTLLPVAPPSDAPPVSSSVPPAVAASGARILVVQYEEDLRKLAQRIFTRSGFEVITAVTLDEARAIVQDTSQALDVAVIDVVLGSERGTDLLPLLVQARSSMRIVITSALAPEAAVAATIQAHGAQFLLKPYRRSELLQAVGAQVSPAAARPAC